MKKCYQEGMKYNRFYRNIIFGYLGEYYKEIEKDYDLSSYYITLIIDQDISNFHYFYNKCTRNDPKFKYIVINKICEIVNLKKYKKYNNKIMSSNDVFYFLVDLIFSYFFSSGILSNAKNNISGDINNFLIFIGKIIYGSKKKDEQNKEKDKIRDEYKEIIHNIIKKFPMKIINANVDINTSADKKINDDVNTNANEQIKKIGILELLKIKYYEYLNKKYKPGGDGYTLAKKDFEERQHKK